VDRFVLVVRQSKGSSESDGAVRRGRVKVGAIRTLEAVGFLDWAIAGGSTHKKTRDGELHRKPILFRLGSEYAPAFTAANRRAAAARGGHSGERRVLAPSTPHRISTVNFRASLLNFPKATGISESTVPMGEIRTGKPIDLPPKTYVSAPKLEAALEDLKRAIGKAGGA
jgi:hypothetical protein